MRLLIKACSKKKVYKNQEKIAGFYVFYMEAKLSAGNLGRCL
jgi:hypothetical protein